MESTFRAEDLQGADKRRPEVSHDMRNDREFICIHAHCHFKDLVTGLGMSPWKAPFH